VFLTLGDSKSVALLKTVLTFYHRINDAIVSKVDHKFLKNMYAVDRVIRNFRLKLFFLKKCKNRLGTGGFPLFNGRSPFSPPPPFLTTLSAEDINLLVNYALFTCFAVLYRVRGKVG